tara:strand:+ start:2412 stop:2669 length:258 start_codon:yes stop_codon:yes gene_type:complete
MGRVFAQESWESAKKSGCRSAYEMIILGAHQAKKVKLDDLNRGERNTVHTLRMFEHKLVDFEDLREDYIKSRQTVQPPQLEESDE